MERIEADGGVRDLLAGDGQVDAAAVQADRLDSGGTVGSQGGEELLEGGFGALFADQTTFPVSWSAMMVRYFRPHL